ncbi:MAG TPA: ATP-binding protein [Thermoplasmata archaeon]|nr:ATP-binding protein [Thermoplasmata archaeon]
MSYYLLVRGPLGVGKTTVSHRLVRELHAEYVSIDRILDERGFWDSGRLSEFVKANRVAAERARPTLVSGTPVIFDGNFYWKTQIRDLVRRLDFPHAIFTLTAPLSDCTARDARKGSPHGSKGAREVYAKSTAFNSGTSIDATGSVDSVVRSIKSNVRSVSGAHRGGRSTARA